MYGCGLDEYVNQAFLLANLNGKLRFSHRSVDEEVHEPNTLAWEAALMLRDHRAPSGFWCFTQAPSPLQLSGTD